MTMVYIAGPYRANTPGKVRANVGVAADTGALLLRLGYAVCIPHTMTHTFELYDLPDELFGCRRWALSEAGREFVTGGGLEGDAR